jgi:hypothetical protein
VTYTSVVLPSALAGNRTAQVSYLFGTLGYDCLVSATAVRSDMLPFADFLLPNEQYGLSVVTQLVASGSAPILSVLFSWTSPFSAEIWILIAASLVFGAIVMFVFEGHDRHEDYGGADLMILLRIGRGCYKAFMNFWCACDMHIAPRLRFAYSASNNHSATLQRRRRLHAQHAR